MTPALLTFALSLLTQAFPDSTAAKWEVTSLRQVCPVEEACTTWVEASYPLLDPGPDRPRVAYRCAEVQGYIATCYERTPGGNWELLFD